MDIVVKIGMELIASDQAFGTAIGAIPGDVLELSTGLARAATSRGKGASGREELVEAFRGNGRRFLDLLAAQEATGPGGRRAQR